MKVGYDRTIRVSLSGEPSFEQMRVAMDTLEARAVKEFGHFGWKTRTAFVHYSLEERMFGRSDEERPSVIFIAEKHEGDALI